MKKAFKQTLGRAFAVAIVTVAMCWPALLNGFPLFFPDTVEYFARGSFILHRLHGLPAPYLAYASNRSEIYSVSLLFLHRTASLWPAVWFQAVLTAWILWLVVRALRPQRPIVAYLIASASVVLLTGAAWYVSFLMPDCLSPLLFLSLFLLVFAPSALRLWETIVLSAFSAWAATTHGAFLTLGMASCLVFALLWLVRRPPMWLRGGRIALVSGALLVSVLAQMCIHERLYGRASLFGMAPPFLMARLLGDGPARLYLQQHCASSSWYICTKVDELPTSQGQFLWDTDSIWRTATLEQQDELRKEEMPLLIDTVRAYPLQQASKSMHNFAKQMVTLDLSDFVDYPDLHDNKLEWAVPGLSARYPPTLQSRSAMPEMFFSRLQLPVCAISALVVLLFLPSIWKARQYLLLCLVAFVFFVVIANAFLCGVASGLDPRYQGRVAWLVVFLAALIVYIVLSARRNSTEQTASPRIQP